MDIERFVMSRVTLVGPASLENQIFSENELLMSDCVKNPLV